MKHEAVENAALLHFFKASLKPEHESKFNCISYSLFLGAWTEFRRAKIGKVWSLNFWSTTVVNIQTLNFTRKILRRY